LLQKNRVAGLNELSQSRNFIDYSLKRIDYVSDGIKNFDDKNKSVDHGDRQPDASRRFSDLCSAARLKFERQALEKANDGPPRVEKTLNQIPDLCYRAFNINDTRLKPKIFAEVLERLDFALEGLKQVDASIEDACKVLDQLLTQIEKLLESRKFFEEEIEKLFNPQAGNQPV